MQIPLFKTCCACGETKFITSFYKSKGECDGHEYCCKACHNSRTSRWRDENPEKNKERIQRDVQSERHKEYNERYRAEHPEVNADASRRWREKNPEKVKARERAWREKHPEYFRQKTNRRKAMTLDRGSFTEQEWVELCNRYGNICLCCKKKKPLTIDHVVPLALGGSNTIDNIQPLCKECNCRKHKKTIDYR